MSRTIFLAGIAAFVMAFLGAALAVSLLMPPPAAAQSSQPQELRATRFILVAPDGATLATLAPSALGDGSLQLFDTNGARRLNLGGSGAIAAFDTDGTTLRFRAGYVPFIDASGRPMFNGVLLDPDGSVGFIVP